MNTPALQSPASVAAPVPYREQIDSDLRIGALTLGVITLLVIAFWWLSPTGNPIPSSYPTGTRINDPAALALSDAEATKFDAEVLGTHEGFEGLAATLRLPPKLPVFDKDVTLWLPSEKGPLSTPEVRKALAELARCGESDGCIATNGSNLAAQALPVLSNSASAATEPCPTSPLVTSADVRVPTGLLAAVLAWRTECREQAIQQFRKFQVILDHNAHANMLQDPQLKMGRLYAKFSIAKLEDSAFGSTMQDLPARLEEIRKVITDDKALLEAYQQAQELPTWGLSMAEVRSEWLLAKSRTLALESKGRSLASEMGTADVLGPLPVIPAEQTLSPGRRNLQVAWCAIALRAGVAKGFSDFCLDELAQSPVIQPWLRCAVLARAAISNGRWRTANSECDAVQQNSGQELSVTERLAQSTRVWDQALLQYDLTATENERRVLRTYLESYAQASRRSGAWFRHEYAALFDTLLGATFVVALAWIWLIWAATVRRATLRRFLAPCVQSD